MERSSQITGRVLLAAILLSCCGSAVAGSAEVRPPDELRHTVLDLLHNGRFDEADQLLARAAEQDGEDAARSFYRAFATYWRLLYDPENEEYRKEFERRLDRAIELASSELNQQKTWEAALMKGSAHLLRAQLRATQKKVFKAGSDARKANRFLRRAVDLGPEHAESDFGLGAYQYYATRVPGIVKILRALMAIPGGNREEGLRRLQRAARESHYFALEARMVLVSIYAHKDERLYDAALAEAAAAREEFPETLAVLHSMARLQLSLYRPERALDQLELALARAESQPDTSPSVIATLRFYAAAAEHVRFRPDRALHHLRPLLVAPDGVPEDLLKSARGLGRLVAELAADPPAWLATLDEEALPALGDDASELNRFREAARSLELVRGALEMERNGQLEEAARALVETSLEHADSLALDLLTGRALIIAGRAEEALPYLVRASVGDGLPGAWRGFTRLLTGIASDLVGERDAALDWYRQAEQAGSFNGLDAARLYQGRPATRDDIGPLRTAVSRHEAIEPAWSTPQSGPGTPRCVSRCCSSASDRELHREAASWCPGSRFLGMGRR